MQDVTTKMYHSASGLILHAWETFCNGANMIILLQHISYHKENQVAEDFIYSWNADLNLPMMYYWSYLPPDYH